MQTFDFLNDSHKKSYKQYNYMQPEWLQPPKGEELFTNWIDPYVPKNSQVFRDLCTLICIILISRIIKRGPFRIWVDLRRRLGFPEYTRFEKKKLRFFYLYLEHENREEFMVLMYGLFEQHVLLYGFERIPCKRIARYFKNTRNYKEGPFRKFALLLPKKKYRRYLHFDLDMASDYK